MRHLLLWVVFAVLMALLGWAAADLRLSNDGTFIDSPLIATADQLAQTDSEETTQLPVLHERINRYLGFIRSEEIPLATKIEKLAKLENEQMQDLGSWMLGDQLEQEAGTATAELVALINRDDENLYEAKKALRILISFLESRDAYKAWKLLSSLPNDVFLDEEVVGHHAIIAGLKSNFDSVFEFIIKFPSHERAPYWKLVTEELLKVDFDLAKRSLARMPGDRGASIAAVAREWSETDPLAAARWHSHLITSSLLHQLRKSSLAGRNAIQRRRYKLKLCLKL